MKRGLGGLWMAALLAGLASPGSASSVTSHGAGLELDTLVVRLLCSDLIAIKLVDPNGRIAFSGRDSSSEGIPGSTLIIPYTDGDWEDGTTDARANRTQEPVDTTKVKAGDRGFRVSAPEVGDWRIEVSLPLVRGIISADVWLNVRVLPRGGVLSDLETGRSWVLLRPWERASCTLTVGRNASLLRSRTRVVKVAAAQPKKQPQP